jgi:hypothetical protein
LFSGREERPVLETIAHLHAAATLFLTGLIWYVQIVHYPLFRHAEPAGFPRFQREHERRTTRVVAPAMTLELFTAVALVGMGWGRLSSAALLGGLALLAVVWGSTAWLQVPRHRTLRRGFERETHGALVRSNWVRTLAWSARCGIAIHLLRQSTGMNAA